MKTLVLVGIGGSLGTLSRYLLTCCHNKIFPQALWLYSTLFINLLGCFLIGLAFSFFEHKADMEALSSFFITGCLGGFTTYAAFGLQGLRLIQTQSWSLCLSYIGLHLLGGFLFVFIGRYLHLFFRT